MAKFVVFPLKLDVTRYSVMDCVISRIFIFWDYQMASHVRSRHFDGNCRPMPCIPRKRNVPRRFFGGTGGIIRRDTV